MLMLLHVRFDTPLTTKKEKKRKDEEQLYKH